MGNRWDLIAEHFETARSLPPAHRAAFVERVAAGDAELCTELLSLLASHDAAPEFLEPSGAEAAARSSAADALEAGSQLGAWKVIRLLGRGGMGEVYEVARADGQFEQRAALKVTRREIAKLFDRFNAERQMLARLDHPGIARLLDGGETPDGRPFAVMEYVEGQPITAYCAAHNSTLRERLALFLQVCDAVRYAHGHLIVHRDIKPGNVLVGTDGRARLLDFGIAKPLDAGASATSTGELTAMLLTPDYAAPEQLTGAQVTTATDVYALGLLLFELLTGRRPRATEGRPLAHLVRSVVEDLIPRASDVAAQKPNPPVPPRLIAGDLDAIIAKCLRPETGQRYAGVDALKQDIERSLRGEPVLARGDAGWYVFGRFIRRYRWAAAAVASIIVVLGVGIAAAMWQASRATREAQRAAATRDFLVSVFRESDVRIARDRPAGEITAKELLDSSVERIGAELADDPETQLELLSVVSEIYGYWEDGERFGNLNEQRKKIALANFGATHPAYIEGVLLEVWDAITQQNYADAQRLLTETDRLIVEGGHDRTLVRADWWLAKAESLRAGDAVPRMEALDNAVGLYAVLAPKSVNYAIALANSAIAHFAREQFAVAKARNEKAVEAFQALKTPSDGELAMTYVNLARSLQQLGEFDEAEGAYEKSNALRRRLHGGMNYSYWLGAADHARLVHMRGDRQRATRMFNELLALIPADWDLTVHDVLAREYYAERLAAEGRVAEAIPILEEAERTYIDRSFRDSDLRRARQTLGDAYDRVGRRDDARRALAAARTERMQKDARDSAVVLSARERWARFLLDSGDLPGATAELQEILDIGKDRNIAPVALARADFARVALLRKDSRAALAASRTALSALERDTGLYDVRVGPMVWRVHAAALAASGDAKGAAEWSTKALEASRRYDGAP